MDNDLQRQEFLIELCRRALHCDNITDLMVWAMHQCILLFGADHCHIVERLPVTDSLLLSASSDWSPGLSNKTIVPLAADEHAIRVLQSGQPVIFSNPFKDSASCKQLLAPAGTQSGLSLPVPACDQIFGVFSIYSIRPGAFSNADLHFLQRFIELLAGMVSQKMQLHKFESVDILLRTCRQAAQSSEMPKVIIDHIWSVISCDGGAILLRQENDTLQVALGNGIWACSTGTILEEYTGPTREVISTGQSFLCYTPEPVDFAPSVSLAGIRSALCLPLVIAGKVIGLFWVACSDVITYADLTLLNVVANIAASSLYRARLLERTTSLFHEHQQLNQELQRTERYLKSVVECASDLVISTDTNGLIITWNRAAEQISGLLKEQVIGSHIVNYCAPRYWQHMLSLLQQVMVSPHKGQIDELPIVSADGQVIPISWRFAALRTEQGEIIGIVAVGRNLVEQRDLEMQLFQAAKMASMGVMASGIGHELRNPLGIISTGAQLAQDHLDDPSVVATCMRQIHSATMRASLIIDNLLTFAQPRGESEEYVDLNEVLTATFALLEHQIRQQRISITMSLHSEIATVIGNAALLQQVFTNLILNACHAMVHGGRLTVTTRMRDANMAECSVADQGCGISADILAHIFDPFFTTKPVGMGTGLGLAVSYSIIQQHKGFIEVWSQPGSGSTFTVCLPAAVPDISAQ